VVLFPGRFDTSTAPGVEEDLRTLLCSAPEKLILDFSRTEYVSSAGLRVLLLVTRDQMKAGRKVALAEIKPSVLKIFDMAGFTSLFTLGRTREEAIRKLS
jgi:anti-anti-sigma factor